MRDHQHAYRAQLGWGIAAGLTALALKQHYSVATAAELAWMLRPVALLLQIITGNGFERSAEGEWYSDTGGILLVKGCAGINFMIMSFAGWCWLARPARFERLTPATVVEWTVLLVMALLLAGAAAVLINVLRILAALSIGPLLGSWFGPEQGHRLLGLLIYLPALSAQLVLGERRNAGTGMLVAVTIYVCLMLVTPLITGRAQESWATFLEYALLVLALVGPLAFWGVVRARREALDRELRIGRTPHLT